MTSARTFTDEVQAKAGETVILQGWAQTIRLQSKIAFIVLRDTHGLIQCVALKDIADVFKQIKALAQESVIAVTGQIQAAKQAPGGYEVVVEKLEILSAADPKLAIPVVAKGDQAVDQNIRLDYRWLDLRQPEKLLIFKVWTILEQAYREYFINQDFLEIHSPKLMSAPSEGGAELFSVDYFDRKAYLAQSPQFYKQMAMAAGFERVIEVGPVFRAEPSFTTRHATEFTSFDFEVSFIESHQDVMKIWEEGIVHMLTRVKEACGLEITIPPALFPRLTMAEAKAKLKSAGVTSEREGDLSPEEEKAISEIILNEQDHEFVFITDYPIDVRPFYHMRHADQPELTKSFDLLYKGVEITTGAQREHRLDILKKQAEEKGVDLQSIEHYLKFFQYGCPPHGGAGIGPSRLIMKLLDAENIREVTFLHRGVNRLTP